MTVEHERQTAQDKAETGRLQSFSDGVFAVAITLLVLNLVVPPLKGDPSTWTERRITGRATAETDANWRRNR